MSKSNVITTAVQAVFNKLSESEKSALIMIKVSPFQFSATPVYVPSSGVRAILDCTNEELEKGMSFEIPAGFTIDDIVGEDGEIRTTLGGNGQPKVNLKQLVWPLDV